MVSALTISQGIAELFRTLPSAVQSKAPVASVFRAVGPELTCADREEALKDDYSYDPASYDYGSDDDWADEDANWETEDTQQAAEPGAQDAEAQNEVLDENSAYLEFLNEEVCIAYPRSNGRYNSNVWQAQKFRGADEFDSDDDLGEESLILDSPLDKIDSYQLFAATMHSKFVRGTLPIGGANLSPSLEMQSEQPQFYTELCRQISAEDMGVIQGAITKAEQNVMEQMAMAQQQGANLQQGAPNGGAS